MKRKLFLITDFFPYGTGETFVTTELRHLSRWYDITVVPRYVGVGEPRPLPVGVRRLDVARPARFFEKLKFALSFFLSRTGREEIAAVWRSGEKRCARWKKSMQSYASAELFWTAFKENGGADHPEGTVYYSFWYTPAAVGLSSHRNELPGARIVVRAHGYDLYNERATAGRQPFKPAADKGIDRIVFCCQYGKDYYLDTFHVEDGPKYRYIALGTNNDTDPLEHERGGRLRLISCSNAFAGKRIERIIEALSVLDESVPVSWLHIGSGPLLDSLRDMAEQKLGHLPHIHWQFAGVMENEKVLELYRTQRIDGFITTSETEGSPISIQEAMSFGIPVIATAVGGIPELLENTKNFLISSDPEREEVAGAIRDLWLMEPEQREELEKSNILRWKDRYCAGNNALGMKEMMEALWE